MNPRLVVQQGVFLCPTDVSACFQTNLAAVVRTVGNKRADDLALHRIDFPADEGPEIVRRLHRFGVSYASLYPEIEGFARALNAFPKLDALHADDLELHGIGGDGPRGRPPAA